MKNLQIILFSMAMLLSLNSNGQMIVDQQGEVGIGSSYENDTDVNWHSTWNNTLQTVFEVNDNFSGGGFRINKFYNKPVLSASWNNSGWLGLHSRRWAELYVRRINGSLVNSGSDRRIKKNIRPLTNALKDILTVKPIRYDYNESYFKGSDPDELKKLLEEGKNQYGVIAQEIKEIFPDMVAYNKDADLYSVNYTSLIPVMIKAMQEQQAIIEELKGEIKMLKDRK